MTLSRYSDCDHLEHVFECDEGFLFGGHQCVAPLRSLESRPFYLQTTLGEPSPARGCGPRGHGLWRHAQAASEFI
jgi:hypothetical protein